MKSIFEKVYIVKAQAEKAAAKEFGADWAEKYQIITNGKQFKIEALPAPMSKFEDKVLHQLGAFGVENGHTAAPQDQAQADADRMANAAMSGTINGAPRLSTAKKPVKLVWDIADAMPKAARKDVIAACIAHGVGAGTARTQYQAWFKASQECERMDIRKPYEKAEKVGE